MDKGLLPAPLDVGRRCCHVSVPERARLEALRDGMSAAAEGSDASAGLRVEGVLAFDLSAEPKPLNSGMSSAVDVEGWDVLGSIAEESDCGGVIGGGVLTPLALVGILTTLGVAVSAFCGLIDLARSATRELLAAHISANAEDDQSLPALRAALSCLPFTISSSSLRYLSASSLSRFSDNSRTDFKNAAGSTFS